MKRWIILPFLTLILSCGGDSGTGPADDGGGGGGGGGGGNPTAADSLRVELLDDIADEMESWGPISREEFAIRAADYLNGVAGMAKAEIRPGTTTVWGIFDDGRLLIVPNNRDESDPADTLLAVQEMRAMASEPQTKIPKRILRTSFLDCA